MACRAGTNSEESEARGPNPSISPFSHISFEEAFDRRLLAFSQHWNTRGVHRPPTSSSSVRVRGFGLSIIQGIDVDHLVGFVDSLSHSLSIALSESHTFCTGGSMACFWPKRMPTSYLWRGTFLIGTLPEHSFLFMLIPDNYFNLIPTIPFPSKKSFHSKKTLMFLDYFKGKFQDVLLFFECGLIFCFLNLLWDCLLCC